MNTGYDINISKVPHQVRSLLADSINHKRKECRLILLLDVTGYLLMKKQPPALFKRKTCKKPTFLTYLVALKMFCNLLNATHAF